MFGFNIETNEEKCGSLFEAEWNLEGCDVDCAEYD